MNLRFSMATNSNFAKEVTMRTFLLAIAFTFLGSSTLFGQWSPDPAVNTPICTAASAQNDAVVISDGAGGIITAWYDTRNSSTPNIHAQRINGAGQIQWSSNGIPIAPIAAFQSIPAMISDGRGGAIIGWGDFRNGGDIYAQRINPSGVSQWGATGAVVCAATGVQSGVKIVSDGVGGAILVWPDQRAGSSDPNLYAQRIDSLGVPLWTADGEVVCAAPSTQSDIQFISDGANGAIVAWKDFRNGISNTDIFAQRVNGSGVVQWTANGVAICTANNFQIEPQLCSDGSGGAIITWQDKRGIVYDIYAQRVNSSGTPQWTIDGIAVCNASSDQSHPAIVADSAGTAIIAWGDNRTTANRADVYAQRINLSGTALWATNGIVISGGPGSQGAPFIASDGLGGVMFTWEDSRATDIGNSDVYAQRVSSSGATQWTTNGVPVSTAPRTQLFSRFIANGSGGAIVVWEDRRIDDTNGDIYAAHVNANGTLTSVRESLPAAFTLEQNYPNPFNPSTTIQFSIAHAGSTSLRVFNILGQEIATLVNENLTAGSYEATFDVKNIASGVYLYELQTTGFTQTKKMLLTK